MAKQLLWAVVRLVVWGFSFLGGWGGRGWGTGLGGRFGWLLF